MKRKLAMLLTLVMVIVIATGCVSGISEAPGSDQVSANAPSPNDVLSEKPGSDYTLSDEQMEALGVSQEEFNGMSAEAQAELLAMLGVIEAEQEAANKQTTPPATEEINVEEDVQKYLEDLPPLPEGDREYNYRWSDQLDRITHYIITIDSVPADAVYDYFNILVTQYGYEPGGKEQWDDATQTATYDFRTDNDFIYIDVSSPDEDGNVKVSFWINYDPYK